MAERANTRMSGGGTNRHQGEQGTTCHDDGPGGYHTMTTRDVPHDHKDERGGTHGHEDERGAPQGHDDKRGGTTWP